MKFIADLHIHSYLSRATAKNLDLENINLWAQLKGITVVGTGDFTHPKWFSEIRDKLEPAEEGLFKLGKEFADPSANQVPQSCRGPVRFVLSVEISSIYKKNGRVRKIHNILFAPDLASAEKINARLERIGNIRSDGRPILGLDAKNLLEIVLEVSESAFLVPAHIWTPWFSLLGSKSGFDAVEECFEDLTPHIFAVETGLSSDPSMNRMVSKLDGLVLVSNSDAHSPANLGREANLFDTELSYRGILNGLRTGDPERFLGTLEYFPEEGKYHYDGHRKCAARLSPAETMKNGNLCPVCGKEITIGVMHRVLELADRKEGKNPERSYPFTRLLPLTDVLAEMFRVGAKSKRVQGSYHELLSRIGPEFSILRESSPEELESKGSTLLAEAIQRMRKGEVRISPGYDGEFGKIRLFEDEELSRLSGQKSLFHHHHPSLPPHPNAVELRNAVRIPSPRPRGEGRVRGFKTAFAPPRLLPLPQDGGEGENIPGLSCEMLPISVCPGVSFQGEEPKIPRLPKGKDSAGSVEREIELNDAQRKAVEARGPLLIIAGPGTGKTRTITHRIARLLAQRLARPDQILAITFTNKAAEEMRERIGCLIQDAEVMREITIGTFHSFCHHILSSERAGFFSLLTGSDRFEFMRGIFPSGWRVAGLAEAISRAKQYLLGPNDDLGVMDGKEPEQLRQAYEAYQNALGGKGLFDFDDLIFETVRLLETNEPIRRKYNERFLHICVDEYQDINYAQYRLIRALAPEGKDLCAIGDPDQAIYGFRGSDVRFFHRFQEDYPWAAVIRLNRNYRSTETIIDASMQVINKDDEERLWSGINGASRITIAELPTERAEAEYIVRAVEAGIGGISHFSIDTGRANRIEMGEKTFSDFAVLYRTNEQGKVLEEAFSGSGIPFQRTGKERIGERKGIRELRYCLQKLHLDENGIAEEVTAVKQFAFLDSDLGGICGAVRGKTVPEVLDLILEDLNFFKVLCKEEDFTENMRLIRVIAGQCAEGIPGFLARLALHSEADLHDPRAERVTLMTLHAAKGLEFPVVFIAGCEDGFIPLRLPGEGAVDAAEEKRLFYVGLTRAKERLFLTYARRRTLYGSRTLRDPSPFLADMESRLKDLQRPLEGRDQHLELQKQFELFKR
ncbi:MAG: UvrD-helicase domain-containing protein [Pseudomonadota bacterium]